MQDTMTKFGRVRITAALRCLAVVSCLVAAALVGGEPPAPPAAPAAEADKKPAEEKAFAFEPGPRRDPFCFRRKPDIPIEPRNPTPNTPTRDDPTVPIDPAQLEKRKADAEKAYAEAEAAFLDVGREGRSLDIMAQCDVGLDVIKDVPNIAKYPDLMLVRERLLDMRRAADNMRLRQVAEKKFRELSVRLTGVVFRDRHSQAIVNGKTVGRGDVVAISDSNEVVVDEIRPDQVVFVFQGYKMLLTLSDMPLAR